MTKRVFLVHGWGGSPRGGWYPWLKEELEARSFDVHIPEMPNTENPKLAEWIFHLANEVKTSDKNTYFIGHSLGCITIAQYLQSLPESEKVGGCLFVAGFGKGIGYSEIAEFYQSPLNVDKVRQHTENLVTLFSEDDEVVPLDKGIEFQQEIGAKLVIEKNAGHFDNYKHNIILKEFLNLVK